MSGEQDWLLPTKKDTDGKFLSFPIKCDDESWQWALAMPRIIAKDDPKGVEDWRSDENKLNPKTVEDTWKAIFKHPAEPLVSKPTGPMTKEAFHDAVRAEMVKVWGGEKCGFKMSTVPSIDGDEVFLLVELPTKATTKEDMAVQLADKFEVRMPVAVKSYDIDTIQDPSGPIKDTHYPTSEYDTGVFRKGGVPMQLHMRYDVGIMNKFDSFRDVDAIRMCQRRMREFISFEALLKHKIVTQIFPIHRYAASEYFWNKGWSNWTPGKVFTIASDATIDDVRTYFGEEVAFFFHFFTYLTKWLSVPAVLGFIAFFRQLPQAGLSVAQERIVQIAFATIIVAWSALFTAKYKQTANMKISQWGMKNWSAVAQVRKEFDRIKRGTWTETIQNAAHWKLAIFFMIETVAFVAVANVFRMGAHAAMAAKEASYFGLAPKLANTVGKLAITANIKVVNALWTILSPTLTGWENHRTDSEMKDAMVTKLFCVKFIIYYYPFFYIAFIKKYNEGCLSETRGCIPELKENLAIFFVTHVITTVVGIIIPTAMTYMKIRGEQKPGKTYTFIQAQAKCPPYAGDTNDFMELTLSFGFVVMFSVALPVMTFLFFLVNLIELKLLAYRMTSVNQRSVPKGQEGIGAWYGIIVAVSFVAVAVNVGMACFTMHPIIDHDIEFRLLMFVALEHLMLFLIFVVQSAVRERAIPQEEADAFNESVVDEILGGEGHEVKAAAKNPPNVKVNAA